MIQKTYKYFAAVFFILLISALCAMGISADDETPTVPIDPPDVTAISLKSMPFKTQYLVGEKLDMTGAELELTYDTGAKGSNTVKVDWCSGFDSSKVGTKTVTVNYPGTSCKTTFKVEVVSENEIKIVPPKTLTYFVGDKEDRSGLSVSVVYSNGKTAELDPTSYKVSGFSSNTVGDKTVTVTYKKLKATYKVSVFEPALQKITVTKKPSKLSYYIGDKLDISGIKVVATYENGQTVDVTSKITVDGDISSPGVKKITVVYSERDFIKSASFEITVTDVQIRNITITSYPTKTVYTENEVFDPSGIAVKVTYNNGTVATVTDGLLYTGFDTDTVGEKTVTLHYGGYELDFNVTVTVSSSHVHKETEFVLIKAPTCTEKGLKTTTCTVCFETVSEQSVPAVGHGDESMPVQIKAPTCTEAGQTSTYCMICGEAVTVSDIFPLGHTEGEEQLILSPTCTENGISKIFCTVCNAETVVNRIDALGHTYGAWTMITEPTGEHEGREERVCSVCAFVESNVISKLVQTMTSGMFTVTLGSSSVYFPYNSNFWGNVVTDTMTGTDLISLEYTAGGKRYGIIEVFDLAVNDSKGNAFVPDCDIIFTVNYGLPVNEYASFIVYDTELGLCTYFSDADSFSFTADHGGRYILAGEMIPEPTEPETSSGDISESTTEADITASVGEGSKGPSALVMILIIAALLLIVLIVFVVYTYVFKRYY